MTSAPSATAQVRAFIRALIHALRGSWSDGNRVSLSLFRFLIPIVIGVKILTEAGVIQHLALPLRPVMHLVGLPAELGLAWAAAMLINIYSGIIVFLGLLPDLPALSVAQATTFALMVLIAHSLILETRIAGQCGLSMPVQLVLRLGMAVAAGLLMDGLCRATGTLSSPAVIALEPGPTPSTLAGWAWGETLNLGKIYLLIWGVMLLQRGIDHFRVSDLLGRVLHPVLRVLGISPRAAAIVIVGFSMGLIYGSGVIIKSAREGTLTPRDVFCAMSLMGIAHSLIEDTLLMTLLGASLWGLLLVRLVLALAAGVVINLVYTRLTSRPRKPGRAAKASLAARGMNDGVPAEQSLAPGTAASGVPAPPPHADGRTPGRTQP